MDRRDRDPRVQQTRQAIVGSFDDLVLRRPYGHIQVADIIDDAGVGRSTFYEHFRNKDEVLRHSVTKVLEALADAVTDAADVTSIRGILEHFLENRRMARSLLNGPSAAHIIHRHAELIEARLAPRDGSDPALLIPLRLAAAQVAGAQFGLICAWLDRPGSSTAAAMAQAILGTSRSAVAALADRPAGAAMTNHLTHRSPS